MTCDRAQFTQGAQPGESTTHVADAAVLSAASGVGFVFKAFYDMKVLHLAARDCEVGTPDGGLFDGANLHLLPSSPLLLFFEIKTHALH